MSQLTCVPQLLIRVRLFSGPLAAAHSCTCCTIQDPALENKVIRGVLYVTSCVSSASDGFLFDISEWVSVCVYVLFEQLCCLKFSFPKKYKVRRLSLRPEDACLLSQYDRHLNTPTTYIYFPT